MTKMNKSIYLAAFAALALTACSNDGSDIFDQSAAERLEQYKKDYTEVLTSDGGLWSMEYFANGDEKGYVFVVKFDTNGSVTFSANHNWIGNEFKQETSLWTMIADNGPVLSFNSYNTLFHIFSDPANIVGQGAPVGDDGETDIDETGFGHEGDYEFQVMEVSDDKSTVRLMGKKRMYSIFLHRLDAATDIKNYLEKTLTMDDFISPYFDHLNLTTAEGERFIIKGLDSGIASVYPFFGDEISQTRSGNVIFTVDGFRFMKPLEVPYADESIDPLTIETFSFKEDGSLISSDGNLIVGPYPIDVFLNETFDYTWNVDIESCSGSFETYMADLSKGIVEVYPTRSLENVFFSYEILEGTTLPALNVKLSGSRPATYYLNYLSKSEEGISYEIVDKNSQALTFGKKTDAIDVFAQKIVKHSFLLASDNIMAPEIIKVSDKDNSANTMFIEVN